jgi:hypothetical protein
MSSLDIAPHPEGAPTRVRDQRRMRRRFRVSFRRAGICTIWRLGFRQFSFHRIARVPRRAVPDTWTRPPVSCHALVPLTFRRQVRHRTQGNPSNPSRLNRGYNEAPRGALLSCRRQGLPGFRGADIPALVHAVRGRRPSTVKDDRGSRRRGEREPPPGRPDAAGASGAEAVIGVVLVGHFLNAVAQKWGKRSGTPPNPRLADQVPYLIRLPSR